MRSPFFEKFQVGDRACENRGLVSWGTPPHPFQPPASSSSPAGCRCGESGVSLVGGLASACGRWRGETSHPEYAPSRSSIVLWLILAFSASFLWFIPRSNLKRLSLAPSR